MMGRGNPPQPSLFYMGINLDKRIRSDHVLRRVARLVDFDFVYGEVKEEGLGVGLGVGAGGRVLHCYNV